MKKLILTLALAIYCISLFAQKETYTQVRIRVNDQGIATLARLGIPVDEGVYKRNAFLTTILSSGELEKVKRAGFSCEVLQEDYSRFIEERNNREKDLVREINAHKLKYGTGSIYSVPNGFHLGSMGGFYTPDEVLQELDSLHLKYPNLVSARQKLEDQQTINGHYLYYVKISDNPNSNENEPKVFYNALIHAREPEAMQQLFFYFNWLLEHYNTDAEAKYLIDNLELYFCPIVNPDGYAYNYSTSPGGGGMWRKNRRDNGDGSFGVDLNRNFGYMWGYDDVGSSPYPPDDTYRGASAFSEAETQVMRDFSEQKGFKIALNDHTYADLFLYPWSYIAQDTPDSNYFRNFSRVMTEQNRYPYGVPGALLYTTNGDSNDWMYGDQTDKPKVYAFTPEIGTETDGFWPDPSRIIPLAQRMMWMNLRAAHLALVYAEATDQSPVIIPDKTGYFRYQLERYGLDYTGTYTVSIIPLDAHIISTGPAKDFTFMPIFHPATDSVSYTLDPDIQPGTRFSYLLNVYDGHCNHADTVVKYFGPPLVVFTDSCNNMNNWTSGKWNVTSNYFHSSPGSLTDSPNGNYSGNENNTITTKIGVSLVNSPVAVVEFWGRWETEYGYDYVQFKYTPDNGVNWYPLMGNNTREGNGYEAMGEPVYDGIQDGWVFERNVIPADTGTSMKFRFVLKSDPYTNYDGYYFDDFKVTVVDMSSLSVPALTRPPWSLSDPVPNPAGDEATVYFTIPGQVSGRLVLTDLRGREARSWEIDGSNTFVKMDLAGLAPGIYFYRIETGSGESGVKKMIIR